MYAVRNYRIFDVKPIKFEKKCYCLCPLIRHDKFVRWLDMINLRGFYAGNNLKVAKTIKYAIYF